MPRQIGLESRVTGRRAAITGRRSLGRAQSNESHRRSATRATRHGWLPRNWETQRLPSTGPMRSRSWAAHRIPMVVSGNARFVSPLLDRCRHGFDYPDRDVDGQGLEAANADVSARFDGTNYILVPVGLLTVSPRRHGPPRPTGQRFFG